MNFLDDSAQDVERGRRARWRAFHQERAAVAATWRDAGYPHPAPSFPSFPADLVDLRCGAKTRAGTPCQRKDLWDSGRCKLHGGKSTGPTSAEGKARAALNGLLPKRKRTP